MDASRKWQVAKEWMIFAVSMGAGAHIVLGFILHTPDRWPWDHSGTYAILTGLSVYVATQSTRALWWVARGRKRHVSSHHR